MGAPLHIRRVTSILVAEVTIVVSVLGSRSGRSSPVVLAGPTRYPSCPARLGPHLHRRVPRGSFTCADSAPGTSPLDHTGLHHPPCPDSQGRTFLGGPDTGGFYRGPREPEVVPDVDTTHNSWFRVSILPPSRETRGPKMSDGTRCRRGARCRRRCPSLDRRSPPLPPEVGPTGPQTF